MSNTQGSDNGTKTPAPDLYTGETPVESAHKTWAAVQKDLSYAIGPNVHRSWTGRLHIAGADRCFSVTLTAPTRFIASKIESNYTEILRRLWKKHDHVAPPRNVVISRPANEAATMAQKIWQFVGHLHPRRRFFLPCLHLCKVPLPRKRRIRRWSAPKIYI